jgi:hypothetical protein
MAGKHRHNIAIQEAGHAVIARIFGLSLRVTRVLAHSLQDANVEHETAAYLAENSAVPTQIAAYEKDAILALAGNAANRVDHPHLPHFDVMTDDSVDMTNARQAIYKIVCLVTRAWPMPQRDVIAIRVDAALQAAMTKVYDRVLQKTADLVDQYWPAIVCVAKYLERHGAINDQATLDDLIERGGRQAT